CGRACDRPRSLHACRVARVWAYPSHASHASQRSSGAGFRAGVPSRMPSHASRPRSRARASAFPLQSKERKGRGAGMSRPETAGFREFAALAGFKPSYVTELRKVGRLVLTGDGKRVRVAESLALIEQTRDPAKAGVAARHAAARAAVSG